MSELNILVVEDEKLQREILSGLLRKEGYSLYEAETGEQALNILDRYPIDVSLVDLKLPDTDGVSLIKEMRKKDPEIDIIMITAFGTIETAIEALKAGAGDYLTKPVNFDDLLIKLKKIKEKRSLISENKVLKETLKEKLKAEDFVFASDKMKEVASLIVRVAKTDSTCVIEGESGVGKEIVANLIHRLSERAEYPLVKVNCAAIPETLLESELFGYEKGAFTGAYHRKLGKFEIADKGTIFLDEIGEIPLSIQPKLLRVLQEKEFERLGGLKPLRVDIRILAATNRKLEELVKKGLFREDLYYRLNVVRIYVPPLRERKEDIPFLIEHFIKKYSFRHKKEIKGISKEARDLLIKYDYPGNVRELENMIERAIVLTRGEYITKEDLAGISDEEKVEKKITMKSVIESIEKSMIVEALQKSNWVQTKAASLLGLSERMLRYKLKKYGIDRESS
ncbi:MAG: sigma-54 dependent transcriptional regulator [Deltaproteobacteria bacterium]|nr:sigma-54 dependent transcriptional regulator [Deltaproteobacteria bacterium]